jgi:hypothetical protein
MIILNPFAFPKAPTVKITKEVRKQLKPDNTILPSHEERDVESMRKFAQEVNLMKVGLMPKRYAEKIVEKVEEMPEKKKEEPTMKIEEIKKEEVKEVKEEAPKNKKERKKKAMKEGKEKKVKIEKLEKEVQEAKKEVEKVKKEKEEVKEKVKEEIAEEIEEKITQRRPRGLREKLFPEIEIKENMALLDIYKKLKGVKFEEDVDLRTLRPSKKLDYEKYIEIIKSKKPKNLKFV